MFFGIAILLIILGIISLLASLSPIRQIILHLPKGKIRNHWILLIILTLLFVIGYISFGFTFGRTIQNSADLIVPSIFFFGGIFVWLSATLSFQTATEVRQITMLEQDDDIDPLTGIFNRRYINRRMHQESARAENFGLSFSILLIEIDNFESLIEFYGKHAVDNFIAQLSSLLMAGIRSNDIIGYYDRSVFLIITPKTELNEAIILANQLRQLVKGTTFEAVDEHGLHLSSHFTVSIGVSSYKSREDSVKSILTEAGQIAAMVKSSGGDGVKSEVTKIENQLPKSVF